MKYCSNRKLKKTHPILVQKRPHWNKVDFNRVFHLNQNLIFNGGQSNHSNIRGVTKSRQKIVSNRKCFVFVLSVEIQLLHANQNHLVLVLQLPGTAFIPEMIWGQKKNFIKHGMEALGNYLFFQNKFSAPNTFSDVIFSIFYSISKKYLSCKLCYLKARGKTYFHIVLLV